MSEELTPEKIKKAYFIAAEVVKRYGDAYLPVFKRMHEEVQKINEMVDLKTLALSVASANNEAEGAKTTTHIHAPNDTLA